MPETPSFRPDGQLERRVLAFLEKRRGSKNIDKLPLTLEQRTSEKADFFLNDRAFVCEVKKLQSDTKEKIDRLLEPLMKDDRAPIFHGAWPLDKVLSHFPNGEEIRREVFDVTTSAVQTFVRKANRQIRTTKEVFKLPHAGGVLVVVNDLVELLSPEILARKIGELFRKRTPDGKFQFPEIEAVWMLCETHVVEISHGRKAIPGLILVRDENSAAARLVDGLPKEWAIAHGMPYVEMSPDAAGTVKFESAAEQPAPKQSLSRQELWERQYHMQPYLRRHSIAELKHYFDLVMRGFTPGMLKGAAQADRQMSHLLLERWTHLLWEIKERGIDMRTFSPELKAMGKQYNEGDNPRTSLGEIEAAGRKTITMEPGEFYTNALDKGYRCIRVENDTATIILLDHFMGKTLEVTMEVDRPKWQFYWPMLDATRVKPLAQRFARFQERHPELRIQA